MNSLARIIILLLVLAVTAIAGPLRKEQVAADAKWLVHLDVDKLRSTTVGGVIKQLVDAKTVALKAQFDLDLDWNKISSLTAYGSAYQSKPNFDGVVLIKTDLDLQKALNGAIEKMSPEDGNAPAPIQKTQQGEVTTYSLKQAMFVSFQPGKPVILSHSRDSLQKAREVLSGTAANLASTRTFSEFPESKKAFFLTAAAEGFNFGHEFPEQAGGDDPANPKAKILKLAEGGRVMLGEEASQLFVDLSLKAKTSEVVTQMQQVIQGMIALASLSQVDNQDLQQLAQSAKVFATGTVVSLQLGYPADKAIAMFNNHMNGPMGHKKRAQNGEMHRTKHRSRGAEEPKEPPKAEEN